MKSELYLGDELREEILKYAYRVECDDLTLFYVRNSEKDILKTILETICHSDEIFNFGFDDETIDMIRNVEFKVKFASEIEYVIK